MSPEAPIRATLERLRGPAALSLLISDALLLFVYLASALTNGAYTSARGLGMFNAANQFLSLPTLALPILAVVLVAVVRPALPSAVPGVLLAATAEIAAAIFLGVVAILWSFGTAGLTASSLIFKFLEVIAWLLVFGITLFGLVKVLQTTRPNRSASYPNAPGGYPGSPGAPGTPGQQWDATSTDLYGTGSGSSQPQGYPQNSGQQHPGQPQPGQQQPSQPQAGQWAAQPPWPGQGPWPGQAQSGQAQSGQAQSGQAQSQPGYAQPSGAYPAQQPAPPQGSYPPPAPPQARPQESVDTGPPRAQETTFLRSSDILPAPTDPHREHAVLSGPGSSNPPAPAEAAPEQAAESDTAPPGFADNEPDVDENDAVTRGVRWPPPNEPPSGR